MKGSNPSTSVRQLFAIASKSLCIETEMRFWANVVCSAEPSMPEGNRSSQKSRKRCGLQKCRNLQRAFPMQRRGRDSNPRYPKGHTGFRNRLDQPLRHLSVTTFPAIHPPTSNCKIKFRVEICPIADIFKNSRRYENIQPKDVETKKTFT